MKAGPLIVLGHGLLELCLVLILVAGLGDFLRQPAVMRTLATAGGVLLVAFGILMVRGSRTASYQTAATTSTGSLVATGAVVSASNPYWSIWWATVGLSYLALSLPYGMIGVLLFFVGHISADLVWYTAVSFSVSRGRQVCSSSAYRAVVACCGIFLAAFGIYLALTPPV